MKRVLIVLALIFLTGCTTETVEDFVVKEYEKINTKFEYEKGVCLRDNVAVEYRTYNRNDEINIVDEDDEFYYINDKGIILAIDRKFVRTEYDEAFEEYKGYTRKGSHLFKDYELNEEILTFSLNDEVEVLDEFADVLYVKYGNEYGYMLPSNVSETEIKVYVAPKIVTPITEGPSEETEHHYDGGNSGGSDPGPSPEPTPTPPPESGPAETSGDNDISIDDLAYNGSNYRIVLLGKSETKAKVLADNIVAYITKYTRDDEVYVVNRIDDYYEVLIDGHKGKMQAKYVRLNSEEPYEAFEAYSYNGAILYGDFEGKTKIDSLSTNEVVNVIDEVDGKYVVKLDDGTIAYIDAEDVSKEKIYIAPRIVKPIIEEPPQETEHHDDGGNSGGSDPGPSPEPSPAPPPEPEWTEEEL